MSAAAEIVADVRFRLLVRKVHALGPRVLAEFLAELAAERSIMTPIEQKLEQYAALDPSALAYLGGDQMPEAPLHAVPSDGSDAA